MSGTIRIVTSDSATSASDVRRKPLYVAPSTGHAAVFINGATASSGSTTSCVASAGTGTGCTISWTATVAVPASYVFAVETDTGSNSPANTVLSEGAATYALVAGTNTLAALSLNGVVKDASFGLTSCTTSACIGTISLASATGNISSYAGSTAVPTTGNDPSSGNVFDNGSVTFVSSASATGLVTGTAYTSGSNTFATYATNTLTASGVQPSTTGTYPYQVSCVSAATGTFGITIGGAATPSLAVTSTQLAGLATPVSYPSSAITVLGTAPSFGCTSGVISSATGTLPVN